MNGRRKWFSLAVLCAAVVVLLLWQRTRMERPRAENAELREKLAAAAQVDVPREEIRGIPPATPNPELLRLRAEVAELRRQTNDLARSPSLSSAKSETQPPETAELPFETRIDRNTWGNDADRAGDAVCDG
jgi:hypothetical protein